MQEPLIAKVVLAQTSTGEGIQNLPRKKAICLANRHKSSSKMTLNWFHLVGKLATERCIKMNLLTTCFLPKRVNSDKHLWAVPLQVSDTRLWPTGYVLSQ